MSYELVDPRGHVVRGDATFAPRTGVIPTKPKIGFLINEANRRTGPDFTAYTMVLESMMVERFGRIEVHRECKPLLSRPANRAMLERYRDCRGVVSGLAK